MEKDSIWAGEVGPSFEMVSKDDLLRIEAHIKELESQVATAKEALEYYAGDWHSGHEAREALRETGGEMTCKDHVLCNCDLHEKIKRHEAQRVILQEALTKIMNNSAYTYEKRTAQEALDACWELEPKIKEEPKRENRWDDQGRYLDEELK